MVLTVLKKKLAKAPGDGEEQQVQGGPDSNGPVSGKNQNRAGRGEQTVGGSSEIDKRVSHCPR